MGEPPLITSSELRYEADVAMDSDCYLAGVLRKAARTIEFWQTAAAEIAHQEDDK